MAIRKQEGRARPFFVYWINPFTRKRESRSCETQAEAEKLDAYIKYQLKYERDAFRRGDADPIEDDSVEQDAAAAPTVEEVMYLYLKDRQFAEKNLRIFLYKAKLVLSLYRDTPIADLGNSLQDIVDKLAVGRAAATVRRLYSCISAVLHWAYKHDILPALPKKPNLPKGKAERIVPPSPEEISAMYAVAAPHIKRVIVLGYYVGCRVGPCEMFRLRWQDVDLASAYIRVPNADKGARDPWREIPISPQIADLLSSWHAKDMAQGLEYVVNYRGKQVEVVNVAWRKMLKRAQITRRIRPYDLRHGFATQLIARGVDVGTVATLMGHASPTMVLTHYQHVLTSQKKAAIGTLPELCVQQNVCKLHTEQ